MADEKLKFLSDENLYHLCQRCGENARFWRQKFAGLLPEVFKRKLYEKKGFSSIYEFAAKLSGMSREQVDLVLRLERKFEDKPVLQKALVEGEISANKLIRIASIATVENQEEIFEKAKILSNRAVEVFVRDVKRWNENNCESNNQNVDWNDHQNSTPNCLNKPLFDQKTLHVHDGSTLKLDEDVEKELIEMQEKGIDVNAFLRKVLQKRKTEIEQEKARIANEQEQQYQVEPLGREPSRYIPVQIKRILHEEYGTKCSIKNCQKDAVQLHHVQRFFASQSHDPRYLAPLCKAHHELAHTADLAYCRIKNKIE